MKKIILATIVSTIMSSAAIAAPIDGGQGTVTFTGSIIEAACGIAPESTDQTVNLGQIASAQLSNNGTSRPVPFSIELVDCDLDTIVAGSDPAKNVSIATVTFTGGLNPAVPTNDGLAIQGAASGASVQIVGLNGLPVKLDGSEGTSINLQNNDNSLLFSAFLKGDGTAVSTGEFTALANFTMTYE